MTLPDLVHPFRRLVLPGSSLDLQPDVWRFTHDPIRGRYTDAQIDDTGGLPRSQFRWQPPLTLTVRARFSHPAGQLKGTAGFGFWNDPFMMSGAQWPALPRAVWFFYASPHSNMKLDLNTPGHGWKAATIDARRWSFFALAPTTPIALPLMHIPALYRTLWPIGQRAIGASECLIAADMTLWHTYQLEWRIDRTVFRVDDQMVLNAPAAPRGRLGFVMWIDNQAMTITPQGNFGWRLVDVPERQWMEISGLEIQPGQK
jgi:hypothetical protein